MTATPQKRESACTACEENSQNLILKNNFLLSSSISIAPTAHKKNHQAWNESLHNHFPSVHFCHQLLHLNFLRGEILRFSSRQSRANFFAKVEIDATSFIDVKVLSGEGGEDIGDDVERE